MRKLVFLLVVVLLTGCSSNKESVKEETKQIETSNPSGKAGNNIIWEIKDHTLTFRGKGATFNYKANENEWDLNHRDEFDNVVFEEGITGIGSFFFDNNINVKHIKFPSTLKRIEDNAFCIYDLDDLILPDGLEYFGHLNDIEGLFVNRVNIPSSIKAFGEKASFQIDPDKEGKEEQYIYFTGTGFDENLIDKRFREITWDYKTIMFDDNYFSKFATEYPSKNFILVDEVKTEEITNSNFTIKDLENKVLLDKNNVKCIITEVNDDIGTIDYEIENNNSFNVEYSIDTIVSGLRALGSIGAVNKKSKETGIIFLKEKYEPYGIYDNGLTNIELMVDVSKVVSDLDLDYLCSNTSKFGTIDKMYKRDTQNDKILLETNDVLITDTGKKNGDNPILYFENKSNKIINVRTVPKKSLVNGEKGTFNMFSYLKPNECEYKQITILKKYLKLDKLNIEAPIEIIELDNYIDKEPKELSRNEIGRIELNLK